MPARGLTRGFTVVDLLAVLSVLAVIFGVFVVFSGVHPPHDMVDRMECMNNVRNLVGLLETMPADYPRLSGPNLILDLVAQGEGGRCVWPDGPLRRLLDPKGGCRQAGRQQDQLGAPQKRAKPMINHHRCR